MPIKTSVYIISVLAMLLTTSGCAKRRSSWDSPDYSRVYQRAHENDSGYTAPSVLNCVDDDLYNCNK